MKIKIVVFNEYALGYIEPEMPTTVFTLADSVIKGAPFRVHNEPYHIHKDDNVRLATQKDFNDFRVDFEGYDNGMYEYDKSNN